jgi:glucosamine-6-phosphate deaminase
MNLLTTIEGSMMEGFFPKGWDLARIDACCANPPGSIGDRQAWWNPDFNPIPCRSVEDFDVMLGHEIASAIRRGRDAGREVALILPVGPMGMYRWAVYFLKEWGVSCGHVHGFNMDEWSDRDGKTLPDDHPGAFANAMAGAFYGPLGNLTVPADRRWFATPDRLPEYGERIGELKAKGAELVVIFGIGRVCHIAFWEPHFAAEYADLASWKAQTHRLGARLHPLTIEQNALTSFKSRTTLVPAFANTIGPGLFLQADRIIGGADGILGRGMQWQGASLWMTLRYGPDPWVPSSFMPTLPGRLFYLQELAGPLEPEMN